MQQFMAAAGFQLTEVLEELVTLAQTKVGYCGVTVLRSCVGLFASGGMGSSQAWCWQVLGILFLGSWKAQAGA
jgi:hypothetical protein